MSRLDLEQQRKRAKDLIKAHRAGDRAAAQRIAQEHPRARGMAVADVAAHGWQLADAQLVVAREAGFASWPRLVKFVEARARAGSGVPLHEVVRSGDVEAVRAVLAAHAFQPWQTREAIEEAIVADAHAILRELLAHGGWVDHAGRANGRWGGGLHTALLLGKDVEMIELLLAGGASVGARDRDGRTPLQIAVRVHDEAAVAALRRAGAAEAVVDDIDRALGAAVGAGGDATRPGEGRPRPDEGMPRPGERQARPLDAGALRRSDHQHVAWAVRRGKTAALPALLALGLDPNVADDDGAAPLHLAAAARDARAIELLLGAGADPDARDFRGETPIVLARRAGDGASVERLARAGASTAAAPDLDELFEDAVEMVIDGELEGLRALLDREPELVHARSLRPHRATLLHYCGANGVEDARQRTPPNAPAIARLLLERGADPNALALTYGGGPAQTPLYLAYTSSHPEEAGVMVPLLEALLAGGARIDDDDRDQIHIVQPSALEVLVAHGLRIDLWVACALGRLDDVRRFVRADGSLAPGAKLGSEATTPDQTILDRALGQAAELGHLAIAEHLLDRGARPDAPDVVGFTSLHRAAWSDHVDVVRLLLARGAQVNAKNSYGATVLGTLRWALENDASHPRPHAAEVTALLEAAGGI